MCRDRNRLMDMTLGAQGGSPDDFYFLGEIGSKTSAEEEHGGGKGRGKGKVMSQKTEWLIPVSPTASLFLRQVCFQCLSYPSAKINTKCFLKECVVIAHLQTHPKHVLDSKLSAAWVAWQGRSSGDPDLEGARSSLWATAEVS